LRTKFDKVYDIETPQRTKARRRERGQANAVFFAHPTYIRPSFAWWLLLTDGEHPAREAEKSIKDVRDRRQRLVFQENYEALVLPAQGAVPRWTWRLTHGFETHLRQAITEAVRHRQDARAIRDVIHTYHGLPGFRGIRHQVALLRSHTIAEWKRTKSEEECPYLPTRMPAYVRYRSYRTVPHETIQDRIARGLPPFSLEMRYGEQHPKVTEGDGAADSLRSEREYAD